MVKPKNYIGKVFDLNLEISGQLVNYPQLVYSQIDS